MKLVTQDNVEIYYDHKKVKNNKHTLILIHGLGGDLNAWKDDRNLLHKLGYSTLAMDLRGCGLSDRPEGSEKYSIDRLSTDIIEIIDKERVKNATIVGHCFGGMLAMNIAANHGKRIKALILVDTSYKSPYFSKYITNNEMLRDIIVKLIPHLPKAHFHKRRDFSKFINTADWHVRRILSDVLHTSMRSYLMIAEHISRFDGRQLLDKISVPTLVIEGTHDSIFPTDIAEYIHNRIEHSELIYIPKANHILVLNNPDELAMSIASFMKKLDIIEQ